MFVRIPPKYSVSEIMGYLKAKSSLMIFERHANLKYKYGNRHFWCRGYYVDTFSNQDGGGVLVFGLDESSGFKAVGIYDIQGLQKQVTQQCNQMEPPVRAVFIFAEFSGTDICCAEIPGIDYVKRPCYYKGIGKVKGSYVRVGDANLPMTDYEVYNYEAYRRHTQEDIRCVDQAGWQLLDMDKVRLYVAKKNLERSRFSQMDEKLVYEMLSITRNGVPTLAAVMNFGFYPQGCFPQLGITAVVVPGYEIGDTEADSARFSDNKRIEGTISEMIEDALSFCLRNMKVRTIIDPDTGKRRDKTEYPVNAVREAILNALIHRDYSAHTEGIPVQIDFFANRLEIHSPGNLYGRMTVEQLGCGRPDLRNPVLAVMAESLTGAENRYSGIPIMVKEMKAHGLPAPVFENRRNEFVVTFYNSSAGSVSYMQPPSEACKSYKDLGSNSMVRETAGWMNSYGGNVKIEKCISEFGDTKDFGALLEFCRVPRTRSEIGEFLGVKTNFYVTSKYINPLVAEGKLELTLPDKPKSKLQRYVTVRLE